MKKFSIIEGKNCLVCGYKASAYNFHGLSCDSCKVFFRRNKNKQLKCVKENNLCPIDIGTRKCCPSCRLAKCFAIGMRKELACLRKNGKRAQDKFQIPDQEIQQVINREEQTFFKPELNAHEVELIAELSNAMRFFISELFYEKIGQVDNFFDAFHLQSLYTKKIIKYCKSIPSFRDLTQEDQLTVLKPFHSELMSIYNVFNYDVVLQGYYTMKSESEKQLTFVPVRCFYGGCNKLDLMEYCRNFMHSMNLALENDANLRNLLIAYMLFSIRDNISCPEFFNYQRRVYSRLLHRYLSLKYKKNSCSEIEQKFSSLILMLKELSFIRSAKQEIFQRAQKDRVDQVIAELYDLQ